jgi:pilus assembly protein Flp/PilA
MTKLISAAKKFVVAEEGATMVEYGLMVALIAAVCITIVTQLGQGINTKFGEVNTAVGG